MITSRMGAAALLASIALIACSTTTDPVPRGPAVAVASITPVGGTTGVDPTAAITVAFTHRMMAGMEMLVLLHAGTVAGPTVAGSSVWSADRTQLTFTPNRPLEPSSTYVLHLSPQLKDANGSPIDFSGCSQAVGGQPIPSGSMPGGMMSGQMGSGMMSGPGWQQGSGDWGRGMIITFMTR